MDVAAERADIPLYVALASATDGPILELACGTGRLAIPLAAAGHHVTGVDNDPQMLERAAVAWTHATNSKSESQAARGTLALIEADMTTLRLGQRFDLVILGFNSLLLAPDQATQESTLRRMSEHLSPDGRAVIDVWLPTSEDLDEYDGHENIDWTRRDPGTGEMVEKKWRATYDATTRQATVQTTFTRNLAENSREDRVQFVTSEELLAMMESVGLDPQQVGGDYSMAEFTPESERIVVVAAPSEHSAARPNRAGLL